MLATEETHKDKEQKDNSEQLQYNQISPQNTTTQMKTDTADNNKSQQQTENVTNDDENENDDFEQIKYDASMPTDMNTNNNDTKINMKSPNKHHPAIPTHSPPKTNKKKKTKKYSPYSDHGLSNEQKEEMLSNDGNMEQGDDEQEQQENEQQNDGNSSGNGNTWLDTAKAVGNAAVDTIDFLGEVFAEFFGMTQSRYQHVIDAYHRQQRRMEEEKEREERARREYLSNHPNANDELVMSDVAHANVYGNIDSSHSNHPYYETMEQQIENEYPLPPQPPQIAAAIARDKQQSQIQQQMQQINQTNNNQKQSNQPISLIPKK